MAGRSNGRSKPAQTWSLGGTMLLIPPGQGPLARGTQSQQVGGRGDRQADRDFQRWRETKGGKIKEGVNGGRGIIRNKERWGKWSK